MGRSCILHFLRIYWVAVVWNNVQVMDVHDGLICLDAEGEFYNPYIQRNMTVDLRLENYPIGLDIDATPYGYLLD